MKQKYISSLIFFITSGTSIALITYLLSSKIILSTQLLITVCGELLRNVQEHIYFNPQFTISSLIILIVGISSFLILTRIIAFILSHRFIYKQLNNTIINSEKLKKIINKNALNDISFLIIKETKLTAYTVGLLKPKVILSTSLIQKMSAPQLEAVILHEAYHIRNHHIFWLLFSRLISSLLFFIPLIEYLAQQLKIELEIAADLFAIEKQKTNKHLFDSLALNIKYSNGAVPHFATSPIEKRIESLTSNKLCWGKISPVQFFISFISLIFIIGVAVSNPDKVTANFSSSLDTKCQLDQECQLTDCSSKQNKKGTNYTPLIPISFSL